MNPINSFFIFSSEVAEAKRLSIPMVALESAIFTHYLPYPQNLKTITSVEQEIRHKGVVPATIALINGQVCIGLSSSELELLAFEKNRSEHTESKKKQLERLAVESSNPRRLVYQKEVRKISYRDFAIAILRKETGGTTVAGTMFAAHQAGIKVFSTGAIGGIQKNNHFDVSTDLKILADTPLILICTGAPATFNLPATLEYLETIGVPIIGYQTDEFPALYSRESGLSVHIRLNTPDEIAAFAKIHWGLGMKSAILIVQPLTVSEAIPKTQLDPIIAQALQDAQNNNIHGKMLYPYLLNHIDHLTNGKSIHANTALLLNNARLAAQVAKTLKTLERQYSA